MDTLGQIIAIGGGGFGRNPKQNKIEKYILDQSGSGTPNIVFIPTASAEDKGYIVNPGIKFGCDFAVYQKGPGIDHAPFLVQVYNRNENMTSTDLVLAGRLASSVKKQFILAIPSGKDKVDYVALDWWKA